jgi:hypothetical protein
MAKGMRWAARIIGIPVTVFGAAMAIGEGIQSITTEGFGPVNLTFFGGLFIVLSMVAAVVGCIISWWRLRVAGILLIATFLGLIIAGILAGGPADYPERFSLSFVLGNMRQGAIMGSPFIIPGILFLLSWRLTP